MNKIFRIIWSRAKGQWVAVSELDSAKGGRTLTSTAGLSLLVLLLSINPVMALDSDTLPTGGTITSGTGTISSSGSQMTINQSSQNMVASWDTFNIGTDAGVTFNQPNSSAAALNQIQDQNPSQILGSLSSNGQVFLINPSGIIFGASATVNVGGLVASSLDISDENFMAGNYTFFNSGSASSITNAGTINAEGGYVAFIAPVITNSGSIMVDGGSVAMAAGDKVSLDFNGDGLITFTVDQGAIDAQIANSGLIRANGGAVLLTAKAADELTRSAVNNSGTIEAQGLSSDGGRIVLFADGGDTTVSGTLDASSETDNGGTVIATGESVLIQSGAYLTASGATGGGEVLVGGSWQGSDDSIAEATETTVESGAYLEANATVNGDGGTVVAWSDVDNEDSVTLAYGTFEAKGGEEGGDGGNIETSGHSLDAVGASVSAAAAEGVGGLWLLDPAVSEITQSYADTWESTLEGGTSVTNTSTGNIYTSGTVAFAPDLTTNGEVTLTLEAAGYIALADSSYIGTSSTAVVSGSPFTISATGDELNVVITAGTDNTGTVWIPYNSSISTNGGDVTISSGRSAGEAIGSTYEGDAGAARGVTMNGSIDAGGGNITITGTSISARGVSIGGTAETSGLGTITITGVTTSSDALAIGDGGVNPDLYGSLITVNGDITLYAMVDYGLAMYISSGSSITTTAGNLVIDTSGGVKDLGIMTIGSDTTVDTDGSAVRMSNESNVFNGTVTVTSAAAPSGTYSNVGVYEAITIAAADALTLGVITTRSTTAAINIYTTSGDLTLTGAVSTGDTSSDAITLNAGEASAAGTSTGGDIIISGGSVSTGTGGRATLYSGSVSDSTGLTSLIGSGSGNFRYYSDESTTNYSTALSTGTYAIYREQPTLTITANDKSMTYGDDIPTLTGTLSGLVNGDSLDTEPTYSVTATSSSSTGSYTITADSASSDLGYAIAYLNGTLIIEEDNSTSEGEDDPTGTSDSVINDSLNPPTTIITDDGGSRTIGLINFGSGTDTTMTLASETSVETMTFSTSGDTVTLNTGEQSIRDLVEVGTISVFSQSSDGNVESEGAYVVGENSSSLSLTNIGSDVVDIASTSSLDGSQSVAFSLTTVDGATLDLTAFVTSDGVLIISGSDGLSGMNLDQTVLMGMQTIKQELRVSIKNIKAVIVRSTGQTV